MMSADLEQLRQSGAEELLRTATLCRVAYTGRDGLPRVIPIGFLWDQGRVVICTAPSAPKVAALAERPHAALTIDEGDTSATARQVLIRGTATIEIVDGVAPEYLESSKKVLGGRDFEEFRSQVENFYDQMARISITPEWARYYDFGAGRLPPFLLKLAEQAQD
jgi:hypothetical protein